MGKCNAVCEVFSRVTGYFRPVANWNKGKKQEFMERKMYRVVGRTVTLLEAFILAAIFLAGCSTTAKNVTASAAGKNLGLDGYVMLGELETANPDTATPQGRLIIGRVTYKSRKVGIPADQKVPTAGFFKATRTKSFFGTEEQIIEYDFTAGSDADAEKAVKVLEAKRAETEKVFTSAAKAAAEAKPEAPPPRESCQVTIHKTMQASPGVRGFLHVGNFPFPGMDPSVRRI